MGGHRNILACRTASITLQFEMAMDMGVLICGEASLELQATSEC